MASREPRTPSDDGREIELKLVFPPEQIGRLRRHAAVAERATGRGTTRTLRSVYFDTPALDLAKRGVALRVRQVGPAFVQTLKTRGVARAGLFDRLELEAPVAAEAPEAAAISDPGLRRLVEATLQVEGFGPVVETEFQRSSRRLQWNGNEALFELDEGEVRTARGNAKIAELELELVQGDPAALFDLALALVGDVALRPALEGKVDRGFALLRDEAPTATRAKAIRHAEGATLSQVLSHVFAAAIEQLQANVSIAYDGVDPEGVHQMRVALRRLQMRGGERDPQLTGHQQHHHIGGPGSLAEELGVTQKRDAGLVDHGFLHRWRHQRGAVPGNTQIRGDLERSDHVARVGHVQLAR